MTTHLRDEECGVGSPYCNEFRAGDGIDGAISNCDCQACLRLALADFGERVALIKTRQRILGNLARPKDWNACPYESHANDCDCRGMGGDR